MEGDLFLPRVGEVVPCSVPTSPAQCLQPPEPGSPPAGTDLLGLRHVGDVERVDPAGAGPGAVDLRAVLEHVLLLPQGSWGGKDQAG